MAACLRLWRHVELGAGVGGESVEIVEGGQKPDTAIFQLDESLLLHLMQRTRCGRPVAGDEAREFLTGELHFIELTPFAGQPARIKTPASIIAPGS